MDTLDSVAPGEVRVTHGRAAGRGPHGAARRLAFLSEAGAVASASLDYETTLTSIARLAVPFLADWCTVYMLEGKHVRRVAVATAGPELDRLAAQLREFPPTPTSPQSRVAAALATGRAELIPEIPESYVDEIAQGAGHRTILSQLGFRSSIVAPLAARGQVLGAMSFFRTGDRRYTPADLQLAEELARRCALAVDNARLYRQAQEAIRVRDEVLSGATHDLKSPLTAISGQVQLLQRLLGLPAPPDKEQLRGGLSRIESATARVQRLVNELLDAARLQSGHPLELELRVVDLVGLVRRVVADRQEGAAAWPMRVESPVPDLVGQWDGFRIERVLDNLLSNAVKYSPAGCEILVRLDREDDHAVLEVLDHGVGIPEEDLPHLFERFHRGANVVGRVRGTGIGLAGAKQIVDQHGGTIAVESEEGRGSKVKVRLPLRPA